MTFTQKVETLRNRLIDKLIERNINPNRVDAMLDHQQGVASVLRRRKSPEYLIDAGLYHGLAGQSTGTVKGGEIAPIFTDKELKDIIGETAFEVVYTYCYTPWMRARHIDLMKESQLKNDLISLDIADGIDCLLMGWDHARFTPEFIDTLFPHENYYNASPRSLAEMTSTWQDNMSASPHLNNYNKNY